MKKVVKGFSGRVIPLFPTMVVPTQEEMGEGSAMITDPHHTPTIIQPSISQPQKTQKPMRSKRKDTEIPQPSGSTTNVADEAVNEEMDDSLVRAVTTASSLEVEQDSAPSLSNSPDEPVWVDNNGNDIRFSTSIVWKDVIGENGKVWKKVCTLARMKFKVDTWENLVEELSSNQNSRNVWTVIRNLCLAAVYYIWQERNVRLFQNNKREANDLTDLMIDELKAKMVYIAVKNSNNVLLAESTWNVNLPEDID
ncbi:hypothetical protein Tco_1225573 [Tanacetum coccineum]